MLWGILLSETRLQQSLPENVCKLQERCLFPGAACAAGRTVHSPALSHLSVTGTLQRNVSYNPLIPDEEKGGSGRLRNVPEVPQGLKGRAGI